MGLEEEKREVARKEKRENEQRSARALLPFFLPSFLRAVNETGESARLGHEGSLLRLGPLGLYGCESLDIGELVEEEGVLSELGLVEDSEGEGSVVGGGEKEEEESIGVKQSRRR